MKWMKQLFLRRRIYGDLSDEIQAHLEEKIAELVARGMPRTEAAAAARREFGNVTLTKEDSREVWRWPSIENLLTDVGYGLRMLSKSPGSTAAVVMALALGIGMNTTVRSEEHTSELQSPCNLVCRLLLEKKKKHISAS